MMASRFTKAFQLTALALVFSVAQVYVMAGPIRLSTDPKATDPSTTSQPKSETAVAAESAGNKRAAATTISAASQLLIPGAASERMPLTAGSKTTLNRIFSKRDVEARIATGSTFLKVKTSFAESFKSPSKHMPSPQSDSGSDDDKDSHGVWIAVGVIAAVLTVAIIGLRHDRHTTVQ
jgi:hypothetical protein